MKIVALCLATVGLFDIVLAQTVFKRRAETSPQLARVIKPLTLTGFVSIGIANYIFFVGS